MRQARFYNHDLTVCLDVNLTEEQHSELFQLNWGPPTACMYSNGIGPMRDGAQARSATYHEAKAHILAQRARKYLRFDSPETGAHYTAVIGGETGWTKSYAHFEAALRLMTQAEELSHV